jgi:hypothetical protein
MLSLPRSNKVRAKFAEIYGLEVVQVKFKFDGDSISDDSTPTSLDLEDEDLIEVVVCPYIRLCVSISHATALCFFFSKRLIPFSPSLSLEQIDKALYEKAVTSHLNSQKKN